MTEIFLVFVHYARQEKLMVFPSLVVSTAAHNCQRQK